jgi:hypothetical protein
MTEMERAVFAAAFAQGALDGVPGERSNSVVDRAVEAVLAWRTFCGRRGRGPATAAETERMLRELGS